MNAQVKTVSADKAWEKGFSKAKQAGAEVPVLIRNRLAIFLAIIFIAKKLATTDQDHERIGYLEGMYTD